MFKKSNISLKTITIHCYLQSKVAIFYLGPCFLVVKHMSNLINIQRLINKIIDIPEFFININKS